MQKNEKPTEEAKDCVIEHLYMDLQSQENALKSRNRNRYSSSCAVFDNDLLVNGYKDYLDDAATELRYYKEEIYSLMNKYAISRETDLVTNCVKKYIKNTEMRWQINEQFLNILSQFKDSFRHKFIDDDSKNNSNNNNNDNNNNNNDDCKDDSKCDFDDEVYFNRARRKLTQNELQQKASAYYSVTYSQNNKILSMPWLICHDILSDIKNSKRNHG